LKWSVQQLKSFQHKGLKIDETIDMSGIKDRDPEIRGISPVHVQGRGEINQQRATFYLTFEGEMILPCSITLVDVVYPFQLKTREIFLFDESYIVDADEEEIHVVETNTVDLIPVIEEHILLEKPLKVISNQNVENPIAPKVGNGWEIVEETNKKDKVDPRLAGLADFFKQE
jgi:uncharacterized protein